ncbi:MAG: SgcJ/EcaC family oxidoreductase [Hyphomonadaceae bacterium]|nr:SgcJ/EcaC family oxidoreductase [Hyphomonadaceae bacterium]
MKAKLLIAAAAVFALGACDQIGLSQKAEAPAAEAPAPAVPPTAEEAAAILAKFDTAYASNDPAQIAALYAPNAVMLSTSTNDVIKTPEGVLADVTEYAKLQVKTVPNANEVQVLDADTIVTTAVFTADFKRNNRDTWQVFRVTQVVQKQADGNWLIVNEHFAGPPKPIAARLPPLVGAATAEQNDAPPIGGVTPAPVSAPEKK